MRHLRTLFDLTREEFDEVLRIAHGLKKNLLDGVRPNLMSQRTMGLLFEKPSLRTRISFEAGMSQLGGVPIYLGADVGWGKRESAGDFVRVLAEYCDVLVCRTFAHDTIDELADFNCIPVINGLSDLTHPCQGLADIMTMQELSQEHGQPLAGTCLTYIGDGNNVARTIAQACALVGVQFQLIGPKSHHLCDGWIGRVREQSPNAVIQQCCDLAAAVKRSDFIYTDVWTSMGQEAEAAERKKIFAKYQVNEDLMKLAPAHCRVLHCLPAHRGEEITDSVMDSHQSVVIQQAGNRMHAQKGLLAWLGIQSKWFTMRELQLKNI